jgi:hypothetical protein
MQMMMNVASAPAVECSALLGVFVIPSIRDAWDKYLLLLATLYMLGTCIWILWDEYAPNFHRKKRNSDNQQSPSQVNDTTRGNLSKLGRCYKNLRLLCGNAGGRIKMGWMDTCNVFAKLLDSGSKLFGAWHKRRQTPNVES